MVRRLLCGLMLGWVATRGAWAEAPAPAPLLAFRVIDAVGAGGAGSWELQNLGTAPARLAVSADGTLSVDLATVEVPPGGTTAVGFRHTGTCPSGGGWGACDEASLTLTAPGGAFVARISVYPPGVGVMGLAPPVVYWDTVGPPPPSPQGGSSGGLGSRPATRTPASDKVYGVPRAVSSTRARFLTQVYAGTGLDQAASDSLGDHLRALAARCDDARTEERPPAETAGRMVWGADGRVSGLVMEIGSAGSKLCLVRGLLGVGIPRATAGQVSFHVRAAPVPGAAILAVDGTLRLRPGEATAVSLQNLGAALVSVRVLGGADLEVPYAPAFLSAGETETLSTRYTGSCPPDAAPCARRSLRVLGVNGILEIPVEIWPTLPPAPPPARIHWSTGGPPASPQAILPDPAWTAVLTSAAEGCALSGPLAGHASWGEDGHVETVVVEAGDSPLARVCLLPALFRATLPEGPGAAIFALGAPAAP